MRRQFVFVLFFGSTVLQTGLAQDQSWIVTIATGDTLSQCSLISLEGDSLRVAWTGVPFSLPVESIRKLQHHRPSEFWSGAFYGSAAGALAGTFMSATGQGSATPTAGILGAAGGFVIGGFIADYFSRDDRYDLSRFNVVEKKAVLTTLLLQSSLQVKEGNPK